MRWTIFSLSAWLRRWRNSRRSRSIAMPSCCCACHSLKSVCFLGFVVRRIIELLAELAEVFLQLANAGEALVVVLLDAGALDVDLLLRLVGAVVIA